MPVVTKTLVNHVLELLYDRGDRFFLVDELARSAGAGTDELAGALRDLHEQGFVVESRPAYGVRLVRPIKLSAALIERDLDTRRVGRSVICFDRVNSTNDVAMDSARQGETDGLVVLAEEQRRGRGRQGRRWISPPGANILLSVLLLEPRRAGLCDTATIAAGLAVAEGIEDAAALRTGLKWPNDVLLDGEKVAGVLVETRPAAAHLAVVIGVGINVNASPAGDEVDRPATSLACHLGRPVERTDVVRAVLRRLDSRLASPPDAPCLDELHEAWIARCAMINERITARCDGVCYTGRVVDVSPMHGLTLSCDDGCRVQLPAERTTIVT